MDKAARLESVDNDPTVINEEEGMKGITKGVLGLVLASFIAGLAMGSAIAQDPTVVDAKHYKVMFENEQVRVLKITYGPKEKSVMHEHPNGVAVFITDGQIKFELPDGKSQDAVVKAGQAMFAPGGKHLPENVGDKPFEVVLVELKTK
jgi:quercetin dioxygenase-like cupin family protein